MKPTLLAVLLAFPVEGQLQSSHYQTLAGAIVTERGDRVPNGSRVVPFSALVTLDLASAPPSLSAFIANAVLEGGGPFTLTVHSSSGSMQPDGSYRFSGDYLRELYPNGTQYLFDWRFSGNTNGRVVWNGATYWAGGHIWYVGITNLALVAAPWLDIHRSGPVAVQLTWATNFGNYILESAGGLPTPAWNTVTNAVTNWNNRISVTLETDTTNAFFRLRKP
jgi:hypothetical protein